LTTPSAAAAGTADSSAAATAIAAPRPAGRRPVLDFPAVESSVAANPKPPETAVMAKATTIKIKLVSSADTGFYYVTKKNSRTKTDKLVMKKYDPVARKHVEFRESKIK
jgi:large subunit ribosomal protein L33